MPRKRKKKTIQRSNRVDKLKHQFLLTVRDADGLVVDTVSHEDFSILLLEGMERAKAVKGSWEVFNSLGKRIDGSYERRRV